MPMRPLAPCPYPGCHELLGRGYCEAHRKQERTAADEYRGSRSQRGYDDRWTKIRRVVLTREPLCRICRRSGRTTVANEVDHIIPLRSGGGTGAGLDNLQPLCKSCHSRKTLSERRSVPVN